MKQLNFQTGRNYYHTIKEFDVTSDGIIKKGKANITGFTLEKLELGDELNIIGINHTVIEIKEIRNRAGVFENPEDKKDSFFRVETSFQQLIQVN